MSNRIIKFRVWDKEQSVFMTWDEVLDTQLLSDAFIGKKATAHQFTGFKDKNGIDIYEGDILKYSNSYEESQGAQLGDDIGEVKFVLGGFIWCKYQLGEYISNKDGGNLDLEIIGNIFQNPELL